MSDLPDAAAALGIPEAIAQRSAEARAAATGSSVEEILAAWAGGGGAPSPPAASAEPSDEEPPESETSTEPAPEVKIEVPATRAEVPDAAAPAAAVARSPVPAEVTMAEATNLPVVVTVPTSGIKERTNFALPRWIAGLFLVVPLFALFALGGAATGECGTATELRTDVVTGDIVNCDGSKFEGSSIGGGTIDFVALGDAIYNGQEVSGVNCAGCHGAGGGGGAGPALNGVLNVFGACTDHIEWVSLASGGFQAAGRSTYGDTNKPVGGFGANMPGFGSSLSEEQLAAVASFERVRFGGADPETVLTDCGLVEEPPAEGEENAGTESGETTPGTETGETTP